MFILYDLIFVIFAILYLPYFLLKKKLHYGFIQRVGILPRNLKLESPIWIHAVSVGEAKVAEILVRQLREAFPKKQFVISTVTATGNSIVRGFHAEGGFVFYLPFDLSFIVKRVIRKINPCVCIILETEIWPNLITQLNKMNLPVILVNARISDHSFLGYRIVKPLIKPILNKVNLFCVRSNTDAKRLAALGVASDKLKITGNMKFDFKEYADFDKDYADYKLKLGLESKEKLFIAGSTHRGEEEMILNTYKKLIGEFPDLRFLIAPRHPERCNEVERLIRKYDFQPVRISQLNLSVVRYPSGAVFILDTIGQLLSFYAIADIVFVGGSLIKKGGHNILEPAYFSKPIIFGPYMFNFREISELFLMKEAASLVHGQEELLNSIRSLLRNPFKLESMGRKAKQLVLENQGATKKNLELIKAIMERQSPRARPFLKQCSNYLNNNELESNRVVPWGTSPSIIYSLITDKKKGFVPGILKAFLYALSLVYGLVIRVLSFIYVIKPYSLNCKVISIGNITLGGTGKTPLVELLAGLLRDKGHKVAVLSRGYKRKTISYQPSAISYQTMGDEPYMLSRNLGDIPVVVDEDRVKGGERAIRDYGVDTVVLDDGFQQWRLKKDLDIVAIDAANPLGNLRLIPRGILREPLSSLRRADIFVLTKVNLKLAGERGQAHSLGDIKEFLNRINPGALIVEAVHQPVGFYKLGAPRDNLLNSEEFQGKKVSLVCGIADPQSFEDLARNIGIDVGLSFIFPDHYLYTDEDLGRIVRESKQKGINSIITTEKDSVRLSNLYPLLSNFNCFVLRIKLEILQYEIFIKRIHSLY
ncbi:MAG: tetraacyldisaccharide 4'-kinase [Candidatus Omnitrophota bacterium]